MTSKKNSQGPVSIYVGVGVGTYEHQDNYPPLKTAVPEVKDVSDILAKYGYTTHVLQDPDRTVRDKLDDLLQPELVPHGGALVILWSGHGEPARNGGLNLVAQNTRPGSAASVTPVYLADLAARTGASQILLILDTCFSGGGVFPAINVADAVQQELPPDAKRVWVGVIASCMDFERAKDGAFGALLIKLLRRGPDDAELKRRWSWHSQGVRGDDLIEALQEEWDIPDQIPKGVQFGSSLIMLPNPIYEPADPERMDAHLRDAARGGEPGEDGFYFTGRIAELDRIMAWMREGRPGALVVTGPPGTGKSAILGRIVSLSNPLERTELLRRAPVEHSDPGEGSVGAHVHALRYTAERLVAAIDEQLTRDGILPAGAKGPRSRAELQGAIQRCGKCPIIVVDGLNESGPEAFRIAEDVLRTLSEISLVLVGTQDLPPMDGPLSLIKALGAKEIIDLREATIRKQAETDLRSYVEKRLSDVVAPTMDRSKVAEMIVELSGEQSTGAFLLARFVTTQLRGLPVDTSLPNWPGILIRSIDQSIDDHIAGVPPLSRGGLAIPHAAGELLQALAWAKGPGLPDDIWPIVATALSPTGTKYERSDVYWLLSEAGQYIIEDGQGGRAVYRLVHQQISDHLQSGPMVFPESTNADERALNVARALVYYYQELLDTGQPPETSAYLWRHFWRHCVDAGEPGIDLLRLLLKRDKEAFAAQLARALSALSKRNASLGRWREASKSIREATEIYRELAKSDPTLRTDSADALIMLGNIQLLVQPEEAAIVAKEAADFFKTMDTDNPAVALPFASALTTLSLSYHLTGRLQEAVEPARDAVSLLRRLSSDNPGISPDLANTLTALGLAYFQTQQPQKAVDAAAEAVNLFRTMDAANPIVAPRFAWALAVLGHCYSQTGQPTKGLAAATEAVDLIRTLDPTNSGVALMLASTLSALGLAYSQTGQPKEGLAAATEAVGLFRIMDVANPTVGLVFASALTVLGLGYSQTGQPEKSLSAATEAVDLIRKMDIANPTVGLMLAFALTVLGQGYSQTGQPKEGLAAATEAVNLFRTMDTANPAVRLPFAWVLSVLAQGYSQTGQPAEALGPASKAVDLFRAMDTANPAVVAPFAGALAFLGLAYSQTGQPEEAVGPATEAVDLFRRMDTANPAVRRPLALALTVLGLAYSETRQPQEAMEAATEAVDLFRTMDTANPAVRLPFAWALSVLGPAYSQTGQPQKAVDAAAEAVDLFRTMDTTNPTVGLMLAAALTVLAEGYSKTEKPQKAVDAATKAVDFFRTIDTAANPVVLPLLVDTLGSLDEYYRKAGQVAEIGAQWEAAIDSRQDPRDKAFLLLRRAEGRDQGDTLAVDDLTRAKSYLIDTDRERIADLHKVCRSCRSADPVNFDAIWAQRSGEQPPNWLTLDEAYITILIQWIRTDTLEAERDFLRENIARLKPESSSLALDEIAMMLDDPSNIGPFRELLERARSTGVDDAYRPRFAMRLLTNWMSSDRAATRAMLQERREELLGNDVTDVLQQLLAENREDPELIVHSELLNLAHTGRDELVFQALDDPRQTSELLRGLALSREFPALGAMATIMFWTSETDAERAAPCFYMAIARAIRNQMDEAVDAVTKARGLDPAQVPVWNDLLFELAAKHQEEAIRLRQLSKALIASRLPEAPGT